MQKVFARVLIKDEEDNILVVQDRTNFWNFPGGKQELGETPLDCAKRETQEEIGLNVHRLTEMYQGDFYFGNTLWKGYFYFAESVSGVPSMNEADKIKGIWYVSKDDKVNFPTELTGIIEKLFKSNFVFGKTTKWV